MGQPIPLQTAWLGMVQDAPRDSLPPGATWNMVDWIPERLTAPLQKRGGWAYASPALGSTTYVQGLVRTPDYGQGGFNLAVTSNGHVYKYTNGTSSDIGTAFAVSQNPFVHRSSATDWKVVIPASSGTTTPKAYDGTTFADLGGTPPQGIYGATWNDYSILANGTAGGTLHSTRIWFSAVGDCTSWDLTNSIFDFDTPVVGIGVLRTGILVFRNRATNRLRGTVPPNASSTGNLTEDRPFDVGCCDARSIVNWNDNLIWSDITGVYMTDGITLTDLTAQGGLKAYWHHQFLSYSSSYTVAAGVYKDCLIVSILDGSKNPVDCLVYDLQRKFWYRFSNLPAMCFMRVAGLAAEKTNVGLANAGRAADLETVFNSGSSVADADGTAIQPVLETGLYRGFTRLHRRWLPSMGIQSWRRLYVNYELVNGGATPVLTVSYATDPDASSYTALSPTLSATGAATGRARRNLFFQGRGVMFKVAQTNNSSDTMLRTIEAEYSPLEESRLVQP